MQRIIRIKTTEIPEKGDVSKDLEYISKSFGFCSLRDKNGTAGKIFRILVKQTSNSKGVSSDNIANELNITRGAVVHHINCFIESGLVIKENRKYKMRCKSLQKCIEEIKYDAQRIFDEMSKIANDIDKKLGNNYR